MTVSVIIPALNEADCIRATVAATAAQKPHEIIVVDAGSEDGTTELISNDAIVIHGRRGRAHQMNAGASRATGDVLAFLHADTTLPENGIESIRQTIQNGCTAGIFRLKFDSSHPLLTFSAFCTRSKSPRIGFGDRCIFASRERFESVGGYREIPIFEDVDLVSRLYDKETFAFLKASVLTSSRRYHRFGVWRQQYRNLRLWLNYQRGGDPMKLIDEYHYDH